MKNYLCVQNQGLVCKEDMLFMGSSQKRDNTNKIGKFGSGWKYAIPVLLRNNIDLKVFAGNQEIIVETKMVTHRDKLVELIYIDGENSNNVTELGPDWTPWMSLREIISNAIDEGDHKQTSVFIDDNKVFPTQEGITSIFIEITNSVADIIRNYESYFAFERKETFKNSIGRIFVKQESSETCIFRKGIRCYDKYENSKFDFDFYEIDINESRLTQTHDISKKIKELVKESITRSILVLMLEQKRFVWLPDYINDNILNILKEMINEGIKFTTTGLIGLLGTINVGKTMIIPSGWFDELIKLELIDSPFDKMLGNRDVKFIETFQKHDDFNEMFLKYLFRSVNITISRIRYGKLVGNTFHYSNGELLVDSEKCLDLRSLVVEVIYSFGRDEIMDMLPKE